MGGTTTGGLDCSGLVTTVYGKFGIAVPRTSREQAGFGREIGRSELKPGDLVFFRTNGGTTITHVGIYSGSGEFIHASTQWRKVKYDRLDNKYFSKRYATARRVL
jgi:cell wall-associated NlpC family hydrolase